MKTITVYQTRLYSKEITVADDFDIDDDVDAYMSEESGKWTFAELQETFEG